MQIIRDRKIVEDDFIHVADGAELPESGKPIVTLARFLKERATLLPRYPAVGVRIASDKLPSDVPDLAKLALIAVEFPKFTDGRGYSTGRMLRDRHGFTGELRAVGWVLRDQLFYLERCGFNAFEMKPGKPLESGLEAFKEFTVTYQAAVDDPRPFYRRR
ncbi:MAG: Oxidoreductase in sulfite reduction [Myxococcales bacterium]|nr:Oxidoreductase in sulfite reduction [Myxococcales bacterium]